MKANPGKLNFGASLGTPPHLLGALFKSLAGIDIVFIPYKGAANSITDMLGGTTHMQIDALTVLDAADPGRQAARARGVDAAALGGAAGRADHLRRAATRRSRATPGRACWRRRGRRRPSSPGSMLRSTTACKSPETKASFAKLSALAQPGSPADFAAFMAEQAPIWASWWRFPARRSSDRSGRYFATAAVTSTSNIMCGHASAVTLRNVPAGCAVVPA